MIGLGTSGPNVIEHFHGVKFEKPFTRMREYVEIINRLIAGEKLDYQGDIHQLSRGFTLRFAPLRPHIPIYIASITPKSVKQTAAIADGWLPIFIPRPRWKEQLDRVLRVGARVGPQARGRGGALPLRRDRDRGSRARRGGAPRQRRVLHRAHGQLLLRALRAHGLRGCRERRAQGVGRGGLGAGAAALPDELVDELGTAGEASACVDALDAAAEAGFPLFRFRSWNATPTSARKSIASSWVDPAHHHPRKEREQHAHRNLETDSGRLRQGRDRHRREPRYRRGHRPRACPERREGRPRLAQDRRR